MKVIDNRKKGNSVLFHDLGFGCGFEWNGEIYIRTDDDYAFNIQANEEIEITDYYLTVVPVNIIITVED